MDIIEKISCYGRKSDVVPQARISSLYRLSHRGPIARILLSTLFVYPIFQNSASTWAKFPLLEGEKKKLEVLLVTQWFLATRHNSLLPLRFSQESLQVATRNRLTRQRFDGPLTESHHMLPDGSILLSLMTFCPLHQLFGLEWCAMITVFGDVEERIMACVSLSSRLSPRMQNLKPVLPFRNSVRPSVL
jgi:hypothetical protein